MATRNGTKPSAGKQVAGKGGGQGAGKADRGFMGDVQDLWQLVVAYFKQETIEPIKGLGRYVAFGLAGSLAVGLGGMLLVLGLLRLLQTETGDAFDGNFSVFPYLITLLVAAIGAAAAVKAGTKDRRKA